MLYDKLFHQKQFLSYRDVYGSSLIPLNWMWGSDFQICLVMLDVLFLPQLKKNCDAS